ncbi:IS1182 family transposase [Proteiniphilum acetatigenes]|uniref:IS1182 family transposase n=1 Tax=Proteiniphilum acetatigenes TaxID=294710 RepID=UPI00036EA99A|nr:IS1182 family transposase [Proteiniphilum acetatigenes]
MNHILGEDRNQLQFLSLEQVVPVDSWARVIDFFVDMLSLDEPGFKHANPEKEGRPPYNPSTLLKLYLYGYKHSIRSSRKMAYSRKINVELWWLLRGLTPSFRTIAYFRKENADAFKASFRRFVLMLKELDIIEGETIAIDSFKIFAQDGLRNNFNQKKIDRHIDYIDRKIEEYEKELNESDAKDKELIKVRIVSHLARKKKYEELDKALKENGENQISLTDPDSRNLMSSKNISGVGYNIQAATDGKHKLFVHAHIGESTDKRELAQAALDIKAALGLGRFKTLSDAGYTTGDQLYLCKQAGITTYSSPMPSTSPSKNCYPLSHFIYYKEGDYYICPDGKEMTAYKGWSHRPNYKSKIYKTKACTDCPIREKCTQNKLGRVIERSEYQDIIDENNLRVKGNKDYYKLRQQIIEHPFGVLKRQWGFTYTLMRGKANVLSEVNLLMIIYNLRRCMTIFGDDFKRRLREYYYLPCQHAV